MKRGAASGYLSSSSSDDNGSGSDGSDEEDGVFQAGAGRRKNKGAQEGRRKGGRTPRAEDKGSCGLDNGGEEAAAAAVPPEEGDGEEKKGEAAAGMGPTYRLQVLRGSLPSPPSLPSIHPPSP